MWENHVRLCIGLVLLAIPVAIADFALLKGGGGGWISLDFSGLLIGAYLIFLTIHLVLSTVAIRYFSNQGLWSVHLLSAVTSIVLFSAGIFFIFQWQERSSRIQHEQRMAARSMLLHVLKLDGWHFSPDPENATEIIISVSASESGRFACGANGRDEGDYGDWYFQSENEGQRWVGKGEHFKHSLPLKRERAGVPKDIQITLYLFADSTGSAGTDVIKIFKTIPEKIEDDGQYFYGVLPSPGF